MTSRKPKPRSRMKTCSYCDGCGEVGPRPRESVCPVCDGKGYTLERGKTKKVRK